MINTEEIQELLSRIASTGHVGTAEMTVLVNLVNELEVLRKLEYVIVDGADCYTPKEVFGILAELLNVRNGTSNKSE